MKMHHFALVFGIFIIAVLVTECLNINQKMTAATEVRRIDSAVEKATVAAAEELRKYRLSGNDGELSDSVDAFFDSLAADFGVADIPGKRAQIEQYVPVIVITDKDGFRIAYLDAVDSADGKQMVRRWTSKIYYTYLDDKVATGKKATGFLYRFVGEDACLCCDLNGIAGEKGKVYHISVLSEGESSEENTEDEATSANISLSDYYDISGMRFSKRKNYDALILHAEEFEEQRCETAARMLEEYLGYYCNKYNTIAEEFGIEYNFTVPAVDEELFLRAADGVAFFALFQGYPIKGANQYYNRFAMSNTQVVEASVYVVDSEGIYHCMECDRISMPISYYNNRRECAENGAMPCECCK